MKLFCSECRSIVPYDFASLTLTFPVCKFHPKAPVELFETVEDFWLRRAFEHQANLKLQASDPHDDAIAEDELRFEAFIDHDDGRFAEEESIGAENNIPAQGAFDA
jgi:hypothetical protein